MHGRDSEHQHDDAVAGSRREDEEQQERRHGEQHVHRAHQQRVEGRARVAGDEADRGAHDVREGRREQREREDAAAAPQHAREHVAAEPVRPEQEAAARPLQRDADDPRGIVRREERADDDERE